MHYVIVARLRDEQDYLETLALLVEADDADQPAGPPAEPVDVLKHLMEARDMNTSDLGRLLGSKGVASEVLNGKRSLSKATSPGWPRRFAWTWACSSGRRGSGEPSCAPSDCGRSRPAARVAAGTANVRAGHDFRR